MSSSRESATPIFDEVDRRWRTAGDDTDTDMTVDGPEGATPPSMLSFTAPRDAEVPAAPTVLSLITAARRERGPRHALRR